MYTLYVADHPHRRACHGLHESVASTARETYVAEVMMPRYHRDAPCQATRVATDGSPVLRGLKYHRSSPFPLPLRCRPGPTVHHKPGAGKLPQTTAGRHAQVRICIATRRIPHAGKKTTQAPLPPVLACRPARRFQRNTKCVKTPIRPRNLLPHALFAVAGRCTEADKAALARGAITLPTRGNCAFPLSSLLG